MLSENQPCTSKSLSNLTVYALEKIRYLTKILKFDNEFLTIALELKNNETKYLKHVTN
jgi:hypothetical protein